MFSIWFTFPFFAADFSFRLTPETVIPLNIKETVSTGPSYGGVVNADLNLFNFLTIGPEFTFQLYNTEYSEELSSILGTGLSAGFFYAPFSRIMVSLNGSAGIYFGNYEFGQSGADASISVNPAGKKSYLMNNLYYRGFADLSFRINPNFTIGVEAGYTDFIFYDKKSLLSGIQAGITSKITIETKKHQNKIDLDMLQEENIYPLFASSYKETPFAYIYITNHNNAEIRNVRVSFKADKYTSSAYVCSEIKRLQKNKTVEVPLLADFSTELSQFSENGQFPGQVIIEYSLLGKKYTEIKEVVISSYNRNTFNWENPDGIVALISPNDGSALELSKTIIGIARDNTHLGINQNLEYSMALFESLNTMGIIYEQDIQTPYEEYHYLEDVDYIQFPFQTITYRAGDCDDLAVLFASMLSSVGINSALLFTEDDVICGIDLNISSSSASKQFSSLDRLINIDDVLYLPVSMKNLGKGYADAWDLALEEINESEDLSVIVVSEAWEYFTPIGLSEKAQFNLPDVKDLNKRIALAYNKYQKNEIVPLGKNLVKIYKDEPTDSNSNAVGMAYLRMGNYAQAIKWFERAAANNNVAAMSNIGQIYMEQKDYINAEKYFEKVLAINPEHPGALQGMDRINNQRVVSGSGTR
ncbi:MAG: tetratricopeptide repeat protein [Treponema sp.]|nr:tetratricopeptide repeat protein [Treponema sp.]